MTVIGMWQVARSELCHYRNRAKENFFQSVTTTNKTALLRRFFSTVLLPIIPNTKNFKPLSFYLYF